MICVECKKDKSIDSFYVHKQRNNKSDKTCKECRNEATMMSKGVKNIGRNKDIAYKREYGKLEYYNMKLRDVFMIKGQL